MGGISKIHRESIEIVGGKLTQKCDISYDDTTSLLHHGGVRDYRKVLGSDVDVVVIATPNYLHYPMVVEALDAGKTVICEKPHALNVGDVRRVLQHPNADKLYPVLQLRYNPELRELRKKFQTGFHTVEMNIKIHRNSVYFEGWKGKTVFSGGLLFNIGVHYFDMIHWFFGNFRGAVTDKLTMKEAEGHLLLDRAVVKWHIDIITKEDKQERKVLINGEEIDLSYGFMNLHQEIYKELGKGSSIDFKDLLGTYELIEGISGA